MSGARRNTAYTENCVDESSIGGSDVRTWHAEGYDLLGMRGGGAHTAAADGPPVQKERQRGRTEYRVRQPGAGILGWLDDDPEFMRAEIAALEERAGRQNAQVSDGERTELAVPCEEEVIDNWDREWKAKEQSGYGLPPMTIVGTSGERAVYACTTCGFDTPLARDASSWEHAQAWACGKCGASPNGHRRTISIADALEASGRWTISIADALGLNERLDDEQGDSGQHADPLGSGMRQHDAERDPGESTARGEQRGFRCWGVPKGYQHHVWRVASMPMLGNVLREMRRGVLS